MKTLLESAVRTFRQSDHITNIKAGEKQLHEFGTADYIVRSSAPGLQPA